MYEGHVARWWYERDDIVATIRMSFPHMASDQVRQWRKRPAARRLLLEARSQDTTTSRLRDIVDQCEFRLEGVPVPAVWSPVLKAVVEHPACPPGLFPGLAPEFPEAFSRNPIVPLLALERAYWIGAFSYRSAQRLLRHAYIPAPFVVLLAEMHPDADVVQLARWHVGYAGEAGSDWLQSLNDYWQDHVSQAESEDFLGDAEAYSEMIELGIGPRWLEEYLPFLQEEAARQAADMQAEWGQGCEEEDTTDQIMLASDPRTSTATLRSLARSTDYALRQALARNPSTPTDALRRICAPHRWRRLLELRYPSTWNVPDHIPAEIASHPNADEWLLLRAADHRAESCRRDARRHPRSTPAVTARCVRSHIRDSVTISCVHYRLSRFHLLACGRNSVPRLWAAARSSDWSERLAAALNPRLDRFSTRRLADDGHVWVRAAARKRLSDPTWRFSW